MDEKRVVTAVIIVITLLVMLGCHSTPQNYMLSKEAAQKERVKQQTQVANPATLYCMNQSGNSWQTKEDSTGGQYGVCVFDDKSWCEEWAYYKGYCAKGTNVTDCAGQFWGKSVCPPDYNPVCAKTTADNVTYSWQTFSNSCNACISSSDASIVVGYVIGACT